MPQSIKNYRIAVAGVPGAGSTTFVQRLIHSDVPYLPATPAPTEGIQIEHVAIPNANIYFWEIDPLLYPDHLHGVHGSMFLLNLCEDPYSWELNISRYLQAIRPVSDAPIYLLGNQVDSYTGSLMAAHQQLEAITRKYELASFHTLSAKTGMGVKEAFEAISHHLFMQPVIESLRRIAAKIEAFRGMQPKLASTFDEFNIALAERVRSSLVTPDVMDTNLGRILASLMNLVTRIADPNQRAMNLKAFSVACGVYETGTGSSLLNCLFNDDVQKKARRIVKEATSAEFQNSGSVEATQEDADYCQLKRGSAS